MIKDFTDEEILRTFMSRVKTKWPYNVRYDTSQYQKSDVIEWCDENCTDLHYVDGNFTNGEILLVDEKDAVMATLKWNYQKT